MCVTWLSSVNPCADSLFPVWQAHHQRFPLLYCVALDILPVQASAVPSERVFSSGKETVTLKRANLAPPLMSGLQILKFSGRQDRLNFTSHLVADEDEFSIDTISLELVRELLLEGKIDELKEYLGSADLEHFY